MDALISVLIPVFNVERYLSRCIESVIKQTYKNIEIILIDDGSKDKSGKICDKYAKKDDRIRVIHKENEGVSVARNLGMDSANGEYIIFVDSDDWIEQQAVELLFSQLSLYDSDLAIGNISKLTMLDKQKRKALFELKTFDLNESDDLLLFFNSFIYWRGPWCKIYKTSLIKKHNIRFPIGVKFGEDSIFVLKYLSVIKTVVFFDKTIYVYNQLNANSATLKYHPDFIVASKSIINLQLGLFNRFDNAHSNSSFLKILEREVKILIKHTTPITKEVFCKVMSNLMAFLKEKNIDLRYEAENENDNSNKDINLFLEGKYEDLYEYARQIYIPNKSNIIKLVIKKAIVFFRKFYYFGLKLG